jgi:RNA polymerase sigma-70 factor (ECF subfamily)
LSAFDHHTDQQLLSLIRQDDSSAFDALYNRYARKVRTLAYAKVNSTEAAQEIVQDIFSTIWERRHSLEIQTLPNYLSVAVRYQVINHFKSRISFQKHSTLYKAFIRISEERTMEAVQFNDLSEALEEGIRKLSGKTQLVFRLNRFEGKSIPEIAAKLNLSEKAIKYHISRSLKELRFHLKEFLVCLVILLSNLD